MCNEEQVTKILNQYKRKQAEDALMLLPILDAEMETIGYLHPITADFKSTITDCVELLDRWREENPTLSAARFPITHERTEKWITETIIRNDRRIVFMIQALDGRYIGHMGLKEICIEQSSALIDMVVRGVKEIMPGLMGYAMEALVRWGKQELGLEHISVMVLWDNPKGIRFYSRCGFKEEETIPLKKIETENEVNWIPYRDMSFDAEKYYLHMRLC